MTTFYVPRQKEESVYIKRWTGTISKIELTPRDRPRSREGTYRNQDIQCPFTTGRVDRVDMDVPYTIYSDWRVYLQPKI